MNLDFLNNLLTTDSPSGCEFKAQELVMEHMKDYCDDFITNHSGNVISVLNNNSDNKILLAAHIDEIGLMITEILSNGIIKATNVGGIKANLYVGQRVKIYTSNEIIYGVCDVVKSSLDKKIYAEELNINIGYDTKDEVLKYVKPGDYAVLDANYRYLANDRLTSKALDDKIGVFVILEALKRAKELKTKNTVYALTSVGEETTMRGASFAGFMVNPNLAIVVDVTYVTNTPEGVGCGDVSLGLGPVLCHSTIVNKKVNQILVDTAKKYNINLQYEIAVGRTGTDADKIYFTEGGIPTALVSIPLKNMHSISEVCDMNDVKDAIELIARFIVELEDIDFNPFN